MEEMLTLHQTAPLFELPDLKGRRIRLEELRGKVVILYFWSADCDWCKRVDQDMLRFLAQWDGQVVLLPVDSTQESTPEQNLLEMQARGLPVILVDPNQTVASRYSAKTTPHCFVIDQDGNIRYQGAFDDVTFRKRTAERHYVREAVEALLAGDQPEISETPPYGCALILS